MSKTEIRSEINGTSATLTFSTPGDRVNALTPDLLHSFGAALARLKQDSNIRSTIVAAEGRVFLAGADIKAMTTYNADQAREYSTLGQDVLYALSSLPSITVAAINGPAMGGGLELALACDFRIAVKSAKLACPEVTLGVIPGWGGISRLTKLIGPARAKKMYLSGVPVSAEDGLAFGLVDEIVNSTEDLAPRVAAFCKQFRRAAPSAVALAKKASRDLDEVAAFGDCFHTTECREGMAAFLEKRSASWMEDDGA